MQNLAVGSPPTWLADRLAAGLAVAIRADVDPYDRSLKLGELEVGVLRNTVVDLEPEVSLASSAGAVRPDDSSRSVASGRRRSAGFAA